MYVYKPHSFDILRAQLVLYASIDISAIDQLQCGHIEEDID